MRFTVEKNWCDRDNMYFYDVVDHHPLRHRRVVSWYTEKPTFKGDRNYGYDCEKEDADHFNDISEEDMETALKALAAHTSQVPPDAIERVRAWKSENGKAYNMKYAESFRTFTLR